MKTVLLSLILSFPLFLKGDDEPIDHDRLEQREENGEQLHFIIDSENPFTGSTIERYENGQKKSEANYKDGNLLLFNIWHKNGQKKSEVYMNGSIYHGPFEAWDVRRIDPRAGRD